jgi:hypothetical protein
MQSFLSASTGTPARKAPQSVHHGAHHPLAEFGQSPPHNSPPPRGLTSIQKLLVFAIAGLMIFLYIFMMPSGSPVPFGGVSKLKRGDAHQPPEVPQDPVAMFFAPSPPIACPDAQFLLKEVKAHHTADDLWIVIRGAVLNVTRFVPNHPGGAAILEGTKVNDAATLFAQFHSPSTTSILSGFCIGRVRS